MEERTYSRGYLPHWDIPGAYQFITWRLHDAMDPEQWRTWKETYYGPDRKLELYRLAESHLDQGKGSVLLSRPAASKAVMESLFSGQGNLYRVHAAVVMPNHVHTVLEIHPSSPLPDVMKRVKGRSARAVNEALGREGRLWQPDYFDRLIQTTTHLERCIRYVHWNPVKAKLCTDPNHFAASTAHEVYSQRIRCRTEVRGPGAE